MRDRLVQWGALAALIFVADEAVALAYFDPNTGSMLVQVLGAAIAMASGIALLLSRQIRALLGRARRAIHDRKQQ
ncbi:MAG: hypothetical protein GX605_08090 [Chloroflexi bacterium]|nr:hypothetical protein [Chloroflexota bacterium]